MRCECAHDSQLPLRLSFGSVVCTCLLFIWPARSHQNTSSRACRCEWPRASASNQCSRSNSHTPLTRCAAQMMTTKHTPQSSGTRKSFSLVRKLFCDLAHVACVIPHRSTSLDVAAVASVFPHIEAMWQVLLVSTSHIEVLHAGMHNFHPASERGPA